MKKEEKKRIPVPGTPLSLVREQTNEGEPKIWRLRTRFITEAKAGGRPRAINLDPAVRIPEGDLLSENGQRLGRRVKPKYVEKALQFATLKGIVVISS